MHRPAMTEKYAMIAPMRFPDPLLRATLIRRYKRFLADVTLDGGEEVTAHCANSGSMMGVQEPGAEVWLSPARNPKRKLRYSWEMIRVGETLVGVNTGHPNRIVEEALRDGRVAELTGYANIRREVRYGRNSRIDLLLEGDGAPCYVEIKSVTLRRGDQAAFPDAVTARGTKHLGELSEVVRGGGRAVMFYLVQREDCAAFTVAGDIDPAYAEALTAARAAGVEVLCRSCRLTPDAIELDRAVPLAL
jgi:sugar fermentation stimulation protein A